MTINRSQPESRHAAALCGLALINYLAFYLVNILLANHLTLEQLGDYHAAISTAMVLSTLATLGLEKYALKCIPAYYEDGNWTHALGFWKFAVRSILLLSLILFIFQIISFELRRTTQGVDHHAAVLVVCAFLPVIAMFLFMVEFVSANGAQLQAITVYRFVLPVALIALNVITWGFTSGQLTAVGASLCYGGSWSIGLIGIYFLVRRTTPAAAWKAPVAYQRTEWLKNALPLLTNSLLLTVLAHSGVIILEIVHPAEGMVGAYAVAAHTGTFVVLVATSTNRIYLPYLSLCIVRKDKQALIRLARNRLFFVAPLTVLFLLTIFLFGRRILGVFGPEYLSAHDALCVIATGASASTIFAATPYYLQFLQQNRTVVVSTLVAVVVNIVACFPLAYLYGAVGAAVAYAVPLSFLFVGLRLVAINHLQTQFARSSDASANML